jgi:hypothetical protein
LRGETEREKQFLKVRKGTRSHLKMSSTWRKRKIMRVKAVEKNKWKAKGE